MKIILIILIMLGMFLTLFSCGIIDSGPSNQQVKEIFSVYFQKNLPLKWGGSLMGARLEKLDVLEVKQRGESLKSSNGGKLPDLYAMAYEDCWPVTLHAKGVAMANMIFKEEQHAFDQEGNFFLCKNHFGKWAVEGDMFQ